MSDDYEGRHRRDDDTAPTYALLRALHACAAAGHRRSAEPDEGEW